MRAREGGFAIEGYAIAGLALALALSWAASGVVIHTLRGDIQTAQKAAVAAEGARAKEQQSREGFQANAAACTASVTQLQADTAAQVKDYEAKLADAETRRADAQQQVKAILLRPRPAGMDECQATRKELDDEITRRHPAL